MIRKEMQFGGRPLILETGLMAKQAGGSVYVQYGETVVLVSATAAKEPDLSRGFFPLQVEYREKSYAGGKIPGGFFKREGRPSEKEILSSRLTDRPIRPLFPKEFMCETQVLITVIASDGENQADVLGTIGASAALSISDIPWHGPVAAVRVGKLDGELILNPTLSQLEESKMDIVVAGTASNVVMVEGEAREITEEEFLEALEFAQSHIQELIKFQEEFIRETNPQKRELLVDPHRQEIAEAAEAAIKEEELDRLNAIINKQERYTARETYLEELLQQFEEEEPEYLNVVKEVFENRLAANMRRRILTEQRRIDGRSLTEIRPLDIRVGLIPRVHGSALFTRGETQALVVTTLGTKSDEQILDNIEQDTTKSFILHYNFPPYCVGEVRPLRGVSRREVGHGNLAERALKNFMPPKEEFPYTIRIVSEILESNGSSSMATVCGGSLALMDAGVPLPRTVAGIAMGLITENDRVAVLSDILGDEDHYGDMDFKVAGTRQGITAIQMDLKIEGISFDVLRKALAQAKEGRLFIIEQMEKVLPAARENISPYAPRYTSLKIDVDKIGELIGPQGKTIRGLQNETGATIEVEEDGTVLIFGPDTAIAEEAKRRIEQLLQEPEVGEVYQGKVIRITDFGAFVEFLPGKQGLVHISDLAWEHIPSVEDVVHVGDVIPVKLVEVDSMGRYNLSHKVLLEKPEGWVDPGPSRRPRPQRRSSQNQHRSNRRPDQRNRPPRR